MTAVASSSAGPAAEAGRWPQVRSRSLRRFLSNKVAVASCAYLVLLALAGLLGPHLLAHEPNAQDLAGRLQGPSAEHWLGTDALGRDLLARIVDGTRITLVAALQAVTIAAAIGVPIGLLSGYLGRAVDAVVSAIANAFMSMPPLLLAFAIVGIRGPGITNAMIAIGVILSPRFYRVARAGARSIATATYIEAARSSGCSQARIMWRHVLPNAAGPLLVQVSFSVGMAIIAEASLSFLGLGVQDPQASWGSMAQGAFETISTTSWTLVPPTVAIASTILAFSLVGDAIRDALGREGAGG